MSLSEYRLDAPHSAAAQTAGSLSKGTERGGADPGGPSRAAVVTTDDVSALLVRGAECMTASLLECTIEAGLNEARFRVLDALQRHAGGECSQAELAARLLQSESNLSTLLERMSGDGLITRTRSQTDRRRSLIRMTTLGLEAMSRAQQARSAAVSRLLRFFSPEEVAQLAEGLRRLVEDLEHSPELCARSAGGIERSAALAAALRLSPTESNRHRAMRNGT